MIQCSQLFGRLTLKTVSLWVHSKLFTALNNIYWSSPAASGHIYPMVLFLFLDDSTDSNIVQSASARNTSVRLKLFLRADQNGEYYSME